MASKKIIPRKHRGPARPLTIEEAQRYASAELKPADSAASAEVDSEWRKIEETHSIPDLLKALKKRGITAKTLEILDQAAQLEAQGKRCWPVALKYWTHLSEKDRRAQLRSRISKHRDIFDALVAKYKKQ